MNDDDNKSIESEDEVDAQDRKDDDDTKVEVKFGSKSKKENVWDDTQDASTDEAEKVNMVEEESSESDAEEKRPAESSVFDEESKSDDFEDEVSDLDRELERVEGIESASIAKTAPVLEDSVLNDEESRATQAIDLETPAPDVPATPNDAVLVAALRKQEQAQREGGKKNGAKLASIILAVLLLATGAAAAYFYLNSMSTKEQLQQAQVERDTAQVQVTALQAAQNDQDEAPEEDAVLDDGYRVIDEIGVRFKTTDATQDLLFGYTVTPSNEAADAVAFSTKELASLAVGEGASVTYPCAFTGNVPKITRYTSDVAIGDSTASKLGKQVGESYYVYTAPIGQCAQANAAAQSARDVAVKAVYDSLEALPSDENASADAAASDTGTATRETTP